MAGRRHRRDSYGPSELLRGDARRRADQPAVFDAGVDRPLHESGVAHA